MEDIKKFYYVMETKAVVSFMLQSGQMTLEVR